MLLKRDWRISTCQCATYVIVPSLASALDADWRARWLVERVVRTANHKI